MEKHPFRTAGLAAFAGLVLLAFFLSLAFRPSLVKKDYPYSADEIAAVEGSRKTKIDARRPVVLYRSVDYSQGSTAAWSPKEESPVLSRLVRKGKLPPVAERVGPEPLVYQGVEGAGKYGGTLVIPAGGLGMGSGDRWHGNTIVRWSPQGYPIVPHIAKSFTVSPDNRVFTFDLRRGMKWSDGHPFTSEDILYAWEKEIGELWGGWLPSFLRSRGKPCRVTAEGLYRVKFEFEDPNGMFLVMMATFWSSRFMDSPRHYLEQFHPTLGDKKLIERMMKKLQLQSERSLYWSIKGENNPEHPRLWPWIYRTQKVSPPFTMVRNPYYFMVDPQGRQLPYIDRIVQEYKSEQMVDVAAANGVFDFFPMIDKTVDYTYFMSQRKRSGYEVYHWFPADRTEYGLQFNTTRPYKPGDAAGSNRSRLLATADFRRALSVAVDRQRIIDAVYNGVGEPAQNFPGPESFFYEPKAYKMYAEYDPERANRLLDGIGLTRRDREGFRTLPDGRRLAFFLNIISPAWEGFSRFIISDWAKVGVRVILRIRPGSLWDLDTQAHAYDMAVWFGNNEFIPVISPRFYVPSLRSYYAPAYELWYNAGLFDNPSNITNVRSKLLEEPPRGHPLRRAIEVFEQTRKYSDPAKQKAIFREALIIAATNVWTVSISPPRPVVVIVKKGLRNVPRTAVSTWEFITPGNAGYETFFFDHPAQDAAVEKSLEEEILAPTFLDNEMSSAPEQATPARKKTGRAAAIVFWILLAAGLVMASVKYPYIGKRILIMIPTLIVISMVVFWIIQLPPGDFLTAKITQLQMKGEVMDQREIMEIKELFHLEDPVPVQYAKWLGLKWFTSFDSKDRGLLQGFMGYSMETKKPVNEMIGDRLILSILLSLGAILVTWSLAIPIGIYSAVRQYSIGDYILSFIGFIGLCVPSFLLALIVIYIADVSFGVKISGLFSSQYAMMQGWSWGKFGDLLKHIWVPVVVLAAGGTGGMIRVMRGNLLDELGKPYVKTAASKGLRPLRLLFKYPVRLALNPFISGIGGIFPGLISGGEIVAIVLSLPTIGPLLLNGLMVQDMYLAGSMLMLLSFLGIMGTLVSDLLLLALDPRIRYQGGSR